MSEQCYTVMSCLQAVKESDLAPIHKVRLQIQLVHLLRLLMDLDLGDINTRPETCSNRAFNKIQELASAASKSGHNVLLINELMERIGCMISTLSTRSGRGVPSPFLKGYFKATGE